MVGSESYFLEFNKDEIFKNIIAVEGHLRNVKPEYDAGDLACIVKHLADIEGHCDEAISHSLVAEGESSSKKFRELRDRVRDFRKKVQRGKITPEEGIREIREIRAFFESFNPEYDISKCKTCGPIGDIEKILEKVKKPTFRDAEEKMARYVINSLSEKYGVPPPELVFKDECNRPDFGLYDNGKIIVCRGGANIHVLAHEFGHYLQHKIGKRLDEAEAERFALEVMKRELSGEKKNLYSVRANYHSGGSMEIRDVALLYGGMHLGRAVQRALQWADTQYPKSIFGLDPSLVADIGGAVLGVVGAVKLSSPWDILSALIGGYLSTDLWRHAESMLTAPTAGLRYVPVTVKPSPAPAPAPTPTVEEKVTGTAPTGKYMVVS